jgi:competence protein ComEA
MKNKFIISAILVVIILAAFFVYSENSKETQIAENVPPPKKEISVYVSGQVKTPAVITLEDTGNLRAVDAVNAVGGLTDLADTEIINLAEPLYDGQHIHIPTKEILFQEIPVAALKSSTNKSFGGVAQGNLININTADETELQKIRGVGKVIAGRIIEYRTNNGLFQSIEEIKKVKGIGDKTFEKMKDSITVN